jgi:hypothetical protein
MASAKSVLEKMITAMNRGGDASKRAILRAKDIDRFVKPTPKKNRALEKSPIPVPVGNSNPLATEIESSDAPALCGRSLA